MIHRRTTRKHKRESHVQNMDKFERRITEPLFLEAYKPTEEEKQEWNKKYGPILTAQEKMQNWLQTLRPPTSYKRKPFKYTAAFADES